MSANIHSHIHSKYLRQVSHPDPPALELRKKKSSVKRRSFFPLRFSNPWIYRHSEIERCSKGSEQYISSNCKQNPDKKWIETIV